QSRKFWHRHSCHLPRAESPFTIGSKPMSPSRRRLTGFAGVLAVVSTLAGCTSRMLDTTPIATEEGVRPCVNSAGAYHLPRKVPSMTVSGSPAAFALNFDPTVATPTATVITATTAAGTTTTTTKTNASILSVADPSVTFCLDFLASPTSDD